MLADKTLKTAILTVLEEGGRSAHKMTIIGRPHQSGGLEHKLRVKFTPQDRALASDAFEQLKRDGYIQPTYSDMADPENWVVITDLGRQHLKSGLRDAIDSRLAEIGEHLVEMRAGMWNAAGRDTPDAPRQAAHSARELIDQTLRMGATPECETRSQRIKFFLQRLGRVSKSELDVIDLTVRLIEAEHKKAIGAAHLPGTLTRRDATLIAENAEQILRRLFGV
jgi:Predicted pPIWI-associating nuclease